MKKLIILLLAMAMVFSLCACGGKDALSGNDKGGIQTESSPPSEEANEPEAQEFIIGSTMTNENFEITLTSCGFSNAVNGDCGSDNFILPITEGGAKTASAKNISGTDEYSVLSFSFEYRFVGNKEQKYYVTDITSFAAPVVYFGDYTFESDFMVAENRNGTWHTMSTDMNDKALSYYNLNNMTYIEREFKPLMGETYECRGFILVPSQVEDESETALSLRFEKIGDGDTAFTVR